MGEADVSLSVGLLSRSPTEVVVDVVVDKLETVDERVPSSLPREHVKTFRLELL